TFTYDSGDGRIKQVSGATTTRYFNNLLEEVNGQPTQFYYAGPILVAQKDSNGTKLWYHADRLGSIRMMSDASGAMVNSYDYRPFGARQSASGTAANDRGFTGHIEDASTGLIYMGARYYNATLDRFISADTEVGHVLDPQDWNRYSYVDNNP